MRSPPDKVPKPQTLTTWKGKRGKAREGRTLLAADNVLAKARRAGLPRDSVINVSQLLTVDKRLLSAKVRALDSATMAEVDNGLRLVLAI